MKDIFESKNIKPMLIGESTKAFDSEEHLYELKLDGIRCIAYLDKNGVELRNKRNDILLEKYPELKNIHKQIKKRCILDGELIVIENGKPNFFELQRRSLMTNSFKIKLASSKLPVSFTAYDIIYYDDASVADLALMERKKILEKNIVESERLAISRYIEKEGIKLYKLAEENNLEGIVAKKMNSKYYFDKRTKDWIKIKYLKDDDFVICGYMYKDNKTNVILGQYMDHNLIYKGSVPVSKTSQDFKIIQGVEKDKPLFDLDDKIIWIEPRLVCKVEYMMLTKSGGMRQATFRGLRMDKAAENCISK